MTETNDDINGLKLSNNTYNNMKFFVQIVLPALGVLYFSLSVIWGFPYAKEVAASLNAIAVFLGVILRISSANYSSSPQTGTPDGSYLVRQNVEGKTVVTLELDKHPEEIVGKDQLIFKVRQLPQETEDEVRE